MSRTKPRYSTTNVLGRDHLVEPVQSRRAETMAREALRSHVCKAFRSLDTIPVNLEFHQARPSGEYGHQRRITRSEAESTVRLFLRKLRRNMPVARIRSSDSALRCFFVHEDAPATGLHYHGLIERPAEVAIERQKQLIDLLWTGLDWGKAVVFGSKGGDEWIAYCLKAKYTGKVEDHIDLENSNF